MAEQRYLNQFARRDRVKNISKTRCFNMKKSVFSMIKFNKKPIIFSRKKLIFTPIFT